VDNIAQNLERVREQIAAAARRAGRDPGEVTLVAVTKTVAPERVEEALRCGVAVFGESKIQEARAKIPLVSGRARWHMVGHLQSNKARDAVALFELIHSVDSVKLAVELDKWAARAGRTQPILLEVNVAGEKSKFGLPPDGLEDALARVHSLTRLEPVGLMTITPYADDPEQARPHFRRLRELRDTLRAARGWSLPHLSMGMSGDFQVAIQEGATLVRIGTAIFGERAARAPARALLGED
jgi:pyridoxal phosphate enzyme (YggS family)